MRGRRIWTVEMQARRAVSAAVRAGAASENSEGGVLWLVRNEQRHRVAGMGGGASLRRARRRGCSKRCRAEQADTCRSNRTSACCPALLIVVVLVLGGITVMRVLCIASLTSDCRAAWRAHAAWKGRLRQQHNAIFEQASMAEEIIVHIPRRQT